MKAVLITGANSGIGYYSTRRLAANGFYVYAGVRKDINLKQFNGIDNIQTIKLDVTSQDEIDAAVTHIQSEGRGLYGIVNNAGILRFSKMNTIEDDELYEIFNTNVFGPQRINKAFSPMLIASGGRTVSIGSISAFHPCINSGAYGMSKAALSNYTDLYSREMIDFGVYVGIIEPGSFISNILQNADNDSLPDEIRVDIKRKLCNYSILGKPPHTVADAVLHMMTSDTPKRRYMVVPSERQAKRTIEAVISKVIELNRGQEYEYTSNELIKMLTDATTSYT